MTKLRFDIIFSLRALGELELLAKNALQSIKDSDIHENAEPVDVERMLRGMAEAYQGDGPGQVTVQGHCRAYRGKPLALKRCFGNLVYNAVKYGNRALVRIEDSDGELRIHVEDEGPGVSEDQLARIFEPYYRLDKNQHQGFGLGLGIARNIAQSHGGELEISNRPTGGLHVTLTLPRH
ncbi:MAG: sensor histidine kinase [Pseudomonadota bacterium]|nr:sensor histidine kinase [Pseudomonadota bacterium]